VNGRDSVMTYAHITSSPLVLTMDRGRGVVVLGYANPMLREAIIMPAMIATMIPAMDTPNDALPSLRACTGSDTAILCANAMIHTCIHT